MPSLATPEVKLNYLQFGGGEHLVLIHGLGANLSFWYFGAARLLARTRNLLMYDLRGHGRSSMPREGYHLQRMVSDLVELLDFLDIDRADFAGHSFGGRVAMAFAALHPERVRNLVVADTQLRALQPPVRLSEWGHWREWKAELEGQGLRDLPNDDSVISHNLLVKLSQAHGNIASQGRKRISLRTRDMGDKGLERWQELMAHTTADREFEDESFLVPSTLKTISTPTLLAFGKFSHCLPTADRLLDCLPNARLIVIPGAGHFFPIVKPRFFARVIEAFLVRQETGAAPAPVGRRMRRFGTRRLPGMANRNAADTR
jgi:pimeloyl-ACP methyl ester carboxylesterase